MPSRDCVVDGALVVLRVIVDVLKVVVGIVTEVPFSMLVVVTSVTLSRKTIGGRKEEVESVGLGVVVFEFDVVVKVVNEESVDIVAFFISSTYKVDGIDDSVDDCVVDGALVGILMGAFVTGAFVGFFVTGLWVAAAAAVDGVAGSSVGEDAASVVCSLVLESIAGFSVEKSI